MVIIALVGSIWFVLRHLPVYNKQLDLVLVAVQLMAFVLVHFKAPRISTACRGFFHGLVLPASCRILSIKNLSSGLILQSILTVAYKQYSTCTVQHLQYSTVLTVHIHQSKNLARPFIKHSEKAIYFLDRCRYPLDSTTVAHPGRC